MNKVPFIEDGMYGYLIENETGEEVFEPLGNAIFISSITRELEDSKVFLHISFEYGDKTVTDVIPRSDLNRRGLLKLQEKGADVFEDTVTCLIQCLKKQEAELEVENVHSGLGWYKIESPKNPDKYVNVFRNQYIKLSNSSYQGFFDIKPKGSFEKWEDMVNNYVVGTNLELSLVLGFSSVLNGYLSNSLDVKNLFVHFFGDSSTGKSTALQLAISVASNPAQTENSLFLTWNTTGNALMHSMGDNNGYPVAIDEASMSNNDSFTQLIFQLSGGFEKKRLTKEIAMNSSQTFCTTILSSGEHSLINKSKKTSGLKVRLIEFDSLELTTSSEHSETVKQVVKGNYGHAIQPFVDFVKTFRRKELLEQLEYFRSIYTKHSSANDSLANRISTKYAIILLTAKLVRNCFGFDIKVKNILNILLENERNMESRDIGILAYECLVQYASINKNCFLSENNPYPTKTYGCFQKARSPKVIGERTYKNELVFISSHCASVLKENDFEDVNVVMKNLREKGLLICEPDRLINKRKIGTDSSPVSVYILAVE